MRIDKDAALRSALLIFFAFAVAACANSPDINTPRSISFDDQFVATSFAAQFNGTPLNMELLENRSFVEVTTDGDFPSAALRIELQNVDVNTGPDLNSVFMRIDRLPADGLWRSLSGDPNNVELPNASKVIFVLPGGTLAPVTPSQTSGNFNNFRVRLTRSNLAQRLSGEFELETAIPTSPPQPATIGGTFTLLY